MAKKSFMVKSVLMSMLTAVTFCFASCTDDMAETSANKNGQIPEGAETALLEPYGLTFQNFVTDNDVQILNSDTTEISVSKELAEKLGITSFVNHPLGIWQAEAQLPYARLALAEREAGDHYILTVRPASVAEVVGNKKVTLNTDIYVDKTAKGGQTRSGGIVMPDYAAKYIDSEDVIHPAYIHMTDPFGYDNGYHTDADKPAATRGANSGEYQFVTADQLAERQTRASARCSIISFHDKLEFDHNLGSDDNDNNKADDDAIIETSDASANVNFTSELDFDLNYFITLNGDVHWTPFPVPYVEKFETGLDGSIDLNSQLTFGFKKAWQIKKDRLKKRLCTFNAYTFTFWVGPVPVCVQCEPELYLKVDGGVSGEARVGVKYEYASNFKGGVRYEDGHGWSAIKEFNELKNSAELIKPEATLHAEAGFGLYLGMNVMIYGVAGPTASVGPRIGASADFTFSPFAEKPEDKLKLEAELKLTVNATAGAKLKVLGYELAEYTKTFELAGPWTLVKYPSDGTEHVVGSENPIDQSWYRFLEGARNSSPDYRATIDNALNMLKEIYGYNDERAVRALLQYVVTAGTVDPELSNSYYFFMKDIEDIINGEIQPRYDDYQYQKHAAAGDTQWINEFNWRKICDSLKSNIRWDSMTPVDQGLEEIHQWFLDDFHREPSMASADDLKWLERVYSQYLIEKNKRVLKQKEDVYKALQDKYADKYAQDATAFMDAAKQAHLDFFLQYDFYPGVNDPRMEQLFLTVWEKIQNDIKQREQEAQAKQQQEAQEQQQQEAKAKADALWSEILLKLKDMNPIPFTNHGKMSYLAAGQARQMFIDAYGREPLIGNSSDISKLNEMFLDCFAKIRK